MMTPKTLIQKRKETKIGMTRKKSSFFFPLCFLQLSDIMVYEQNIFKIQDDESEDSEEDEDEDEDFDEDWDSEEEE